MSAARTDRPDAAACPTAARLPRSRPTAGSTASRRSAQSHFLDGFRLAGRQIPLQAGLAERAVPQPVQERSGRRHAAAAGSLDLDRSSGCGASVPAGDVAGARLPQFDLQRDADLARAGEAADRDDPSRRRARATASPTATTSCSAIARAKCGCTRVVFDGVRRGVLIAESIWPNSAYADGCGINTLVTARIRSRRTAARRCTTTKSGSGSQHGRRASGDPNADARACPDPGSRSPPEWRLGRAYNSLPIAASTE